MTHKLRNRVKHKPGPSPDPDTGVVPDRGSATGTPRWVPVLGIVIAILLVMLLVVLHLTGTLGSRAH
jgi:hypothetical protein